MGHASQVDVKVWHKPSTSKKSRKKKQLVASGKMGLGEIVKSQGGDPRSRESRFLLKVIVLWLSFRKSGCQLGSGVVWE